MTPEHALGAGETPRRGGSSSSGWRSQVKLSGGSTTTLPCSSNSLGWVAFLGHSREKKNKFSFPKLALFQFYQLPWLPQNSQRWEAALLPQITQV